MRERGLDQVDAGFRRAKRRMGRQRDVRQDGEGVLRRQRLDREDVQRGVRFQATPCMPAPSASRAMSCATPPKPTRPSVLPCSCIPSVRNQRPSRSARSIRASPLAAAHISAKAHSATAVSQYPLIACTVMPSPASASGSMQLRAPVPRKTTCFSSGQRASITSAASSTRSSRKRTAMSCTPIGSPPARPVGTDTAGRPSTGRANCGSCARSTRAIVASFSTSMPQANGGSPETGPSTRE